MGGSPVGRWGRRSATSPYQPEGEPLLLNAAALSQIPKQPPHRAGSARAPGLRARSRAGCRPSQTGSRGGKPAMSPSARRWTQAAKPRPAAHRRSFRPRLEGLEDRTVPSFADPVNLSAIPGNQAAVVEAADFNNDGVPDLA